MAEFYHAADTKNRADKARAELRGLGLRSAPATPTEIEARIAEPAPSGLTNREIAAAAFVRQKTVEANSPRSIANWLFARASTSRDRRRREVGQRRTVIARLFPPRKPAPAWLMLNATRIVERPFGSVTRKSAPERTPSRTRRIVRQRPYDRRCT
jgi:hypothetical protein